MDNERKHYIDLSPALAERIRKERQDIYLSEDLAIRRVRRPRDTASTLRPAFVRDAEKIMNCPYYNRYADKTQVFSFYKNDDISRRALHIQLVSRIARGIGYTLGLNLDLIEAIAIGHDLGHTPFGHVGERILSRIYNEKTGMYFHHNLQSVRILDRIFGYNISLQVLDGILCHNGELELSEYRPRPLKDFEEFDEMLDFCHQNKEGSAHFVPATLEGCVVRLSDILAYIGKDRQDAIKAKLLPDDSCFSETVVGKFNAAIIHNLTVNLIENSYGKDYLSLSPEYFEALRLAKKENYEHIYMHEAQMEAYSPLNDMFENVYQRLYEDLTSKKSDSVIHRHHLEYVASSSKYYESTDYESDEPNRIVVDYIASMTDDYFLDLYDYLFPGGHGIKYVSYFKEENNH